MGGDVKAIELVFVVQYLNHPLQDLGGNVQADAGWIIVEPGLVPAFVEAVGHVLPAGRRAGGPMHEKHGDARRIIGLQEVDADAELLDKGQWFPIAGATIGLIKHRSIKFCNRAELEYRHLCDGQVICHVQAIDKLGRRR